MFYDNNKFSQSLIDVPPLLIQGMGGGFRDTIRRHPDYPPTRSNKKFEEGVYTALGTYNGLHRVRITFAELFANKSGLPHDPGGDWGSVCDFGGSIHFAIWDSRTMVRPHPAFQPFLDELVKRNSSRNRTIDPLTQRSDQIPFMAHHRTRFTSKTYSNRPDMDLWNAETGRAYREILPASHLDLLNDPALRPYLPSMVGVIFSIFDHLVPYLEIQKIGDPNIWIKFSRLNEPWQPVMPSQNLGEDLTTMMMLNSLALKYPGLNLDQLKQLPEFLEYLVNSYKNKVGTVPVIDGWEPLDLDSLSLRDRATYYRQPIVDNLLVAIGTDGWSLGLNSTQQQHWLRRVEDVLKNISPNPDLQDELSGVLAQIGIERRANQAVTYSQDPPFSQEKKHDDATVLGMLIERADNSAEIYSRLREGKMENVSY